MDECLDPDNCKFGQCINTDGSFRCECPYGYILQGAECVGKYSSSILKVLLSAKYGIKEQWGSFILTFGVFIPAGA